MQAAVDHEPQRRDLKLYLANLEVRAERYDAAAQIFQALVALDPKSPDLLFRLAETERRQGNLNQSMDTFRRCSTLAHNNTRCLLMLGLLLNGTGKEDQAKPVYERILKVDPNHPLALNHLAYIKAEEGVDLDQVLTMAQRARQQLPKNPEIADTLGWIYIKKNLSEDAVRVFQDLVKESPNDPKFHYHFGMALLQKGDRPQAKTQLELALKANPSKDDAAKIHDLLQKI
jgi:Flp pilus assembly protein TadD